jgi:beta-lactamase superfamily II metal-dependent hydrolase
VECYLHLYFIMKNIHNINNRNYNKLRLILFLSVAYFCWQTAESQQMKVVVMHCGQGNAAFVQSPSGVSAILDGSPSTTEGNNLLSFVQDTMGLSHLDYTFLGHYHADHINGMDELINGLGRDSIIVGCYDRGESYGTVAYTSYVTATGAKRATALLGQVFDLGSGVTLQCVSKNGKTLSGDSIVPGAEENNESMGMLLTYGNFKMLFANDIAGYNSGSYKDQETILAPDIGDISVLNVNHHGSATSSNPTYISTLQPEVSIITVGTNGYGHPTQLALDRLAALSTNHIYQTEIGGGGTLPAARDSIVNTNIWIMVGPSLYTVAQRDTYYLAPLAVEFAGMQVMNDQDGDIKISWRTESENNSYQWLIERSDGDQGGFCGIGTVPGRGSANASGQYEFFDGSILKDGLYYYRLVQIDRSGQTTYYGPVSITYKKGIPAVFQLAQNHPNPFRHVTTISYQLSNPGQTDLKVYNILGQEVKSLIDKYQEAGYYSAEWDGKDNLGNTVSGGIYYYRLSSDQNKSFKKLVFIR